MWDSWQTTVDANVAAYDAKRQRTAHWSGAACAYPGVITSPGLSSGDAFGRPSIPSVPSMPAAPGEADMTQRIMSALQSHTPTGSIFAPPPAAPPPAESDEPELGSMLLNSLRTLLPAGEYAQACQSSDAGQQLFQVVQNLSPPHPQQLAAAPPQATLTAPPAQALHAPAQIDVPVSSEVDDSQRIPVPSKRAAPKLEPAPRQEDSESDDGVPHRLPPGFGAIPEDIVEERARQREEQRVLQLKATQPCRFGRRCKKRDCPNAHPEGRDIDTAWNPCAFGRRCKRKGCFYDHPEGRIIDDNPEKGMCKFGIRCSRPDCLYDHPEGRAPLSGPDPRICFFCHDPGHIAGDCPRNPESWAFNAQAPGQVVQASAQRAITAGT